MTEFKVVSPFQPTGDQPTAINEIVASLDAGNRFTTLLGATGTGKTFAMAKVIERTQRPALIMAHNKTLAAQLYAEFKEFFPENAVEYFVSYYDYYQPEAYVARHDLFIEKEATINDELDRLRLASTSSLMSRRDVIIVASVSCIYGIMNPEDYGKFVITITKGEQRRRELILRMLIAIQYERNDIDFKRGKFRVRGDTLDIFPAYMESAYRVEFFGDEVDRITELDHVTGEVINDLEKIDIYPAKHYVTPQEKLKLAIGSIEAELAGQVAKFKSENKLIEAQRIEQRVNYDLAMLKEVGHTSGIENYSRPLDGRPPGTPPFTLLDYFPDDFILMVDESHMSLPQIRGMYAGDQARKQVLVDYGFRLPSAMDNRPLKWDEFVTRFRQALFVSATPSVFEKENSAVIAEQVIRPTGIVDPIVEVRPVKGQVDDLIKEIRATVARGQRVIVTTLTKRMSEDLANYLQELNIKVQYLHSEIQTVERVEILRDLRLGEYDVVIGINLLREGLDLPEVTLVAILDADKEGFLRSGTSLIQTIGRAARHVEGRAIMYADKITDSMKFAIDETNRRREKQVAYNTEHAISPVTIYKAVRDLTDRVRAEEAKGEYEAGGRVGRGSSGKGRGLVEDRSDLPTRLTSLPKDEAVKLIVDLEEQMKLAAKELEFEKAAMIRDQIMELRTHALGLRADTPIWEKMRVMGDGDGGEAAPGGTLPSKGEVRYKPKKGKEQSRRGRR